MDIKGQFDSFNHMRGSREFRRGCPEGANFLDNKSGTTARQIKVRKVAKIRSGIDTIKYHT